MNKQQNSKDSIICNVVLIGICAILIAFCFLLYPQKVSSGPYVDSQHGDSSRGVNRSSIDPKYNTFATGNCGHCHEVHSSLEGSEPLPNSGVSSGPDPAALFSYEEVFCETCHDGSPVLRDIRMQRQKTYHHPFSEYSGRHTLSKLESGQNGAPFRGSMRHAECADCHEPHYIGDPGTSYHTYNAGNPANNNLVSNLLKGVWGVEPATSPLWSPPTVFNELKTVGVGSAKEYQICYKCHSYYALQDADGVTTIVGPSGDSITDQSMEFSPGNKSAHPVQVTLNNQIGSYAPRSLTNSQNGARMRSPWTNIGTQTMWCSDCHGNDATSPVGPHGSNKKFMLKASTARPNAYYWPRNNTNGLLWTLSDIKYNQNNWSSDLFCVNCHVLYSGSKFLNNVHDDSHHSNNNRWPQIDKYPNGSNIPETDKYIGVPCVMCHVTVPHGYKRSRLIVYGRPAGDTQSPHQYKNTVTTGRDKAFSSSYHSGMMGVMTGYKKHTNPDNYDERYCYVPNNETYYDKTNQPRWGCSDHETNDGGYDP